ncbi:unnamed protein product [Blepharisma stoltei]|uniref:Uncharacterized protein n=1 Tax=Blepharisma stoltei TaxID=1481888 RepID=A0AAU9JII0_9CILI|nr:unnamed protein product [Blepharisma stoltei]
MKSNSNLREQILELSKQNKAKKKSLDKTIEEEKSRISLWNIENAEKIKLHIKKKNSLEDRIIQKIFPIPKNNDISPYTSLDYGYPKEEKVPLYNQNIKKFQSFSLASPVSEIKTERKSEVKISARRGHSLSQSRGMSPKLNKNRENSSSHSSLSYRGSWKINRKNSKEKLVHSKFSVYQSAMKNFRVKNIRDKEKQDINKSLDHINEVIQKSKQNRIKRQI